MGGWGRGVGDGSTTQGSNVYMTTNECSMLNADAMVPGGVLSKSLLSLPSPH